MYVSMFVKQKRIKNWFSKVFLQVSTHKVGLFIFSDTDRLDLKECILKSRNA